MPVLSMPVAREINEVSDSDEDGGWWMLLHVFWGVLLYRSTCFSLHCVDVVPLDSTSQEPTPASKAKPVKPKSKAGAKLAPKPKVKGACKPKAKGKAKAKSASKAKSSGKTAEPTEEVSPQDVNGDESEVEEPPRKRPSASSKTLKQKPAAAAAKVKAEKAKKAERSSKISNPYFYSNLNQWGIKVDGKQKISVWLSVICCFSDEALSCL